ncbi:MAG: lipid-A-disaccharide synthase N-terminal domain-containing protein [Acidobacteriota bacterium]
MNQFNEIFAHGIQFWHVVGFLGLVVFSSRFIVQWIESERRKESVIPVSFWYLSIIGSLLLLSYALVRRDPVFILSYLFNGIIYVRNLYLIHRKRRAAAE